MQSNILPFTPSRAAFIRHRLRVEAVLVYLGLTVRVRQGCLFILGEPGEMAVSITGPAGGPVRVEIAGRMQTSPVERFGLLPVIEEINRNGDGILVAEPEDFSVRFQWACEFPGDIEHDSLVEGVGALSRACGLLSGAGKPTPPFNYELDFANLND